VSGPAAVGPGYVYVRSVERYEPKDERSTLREAVELVFIGALASGLSLLLLVLGELVNGLDTTQIADKESDYFVTEPLRTLLAPVAYFVFSYGGVWGVARRGHGDLGLSVPAPFVPTLSPVKTA
jgi:hypothetical protein